MDTRYLTSFVKVAETGSISRAAFSLGLSQPSLSQQIMRVEGEVGLPLFRRTTRGVLLTDAGRIFLDHARRHFTAAAEKWLTGSEPFTAKLNPAYAPYGDYDQLMRLEEWYGR